MKMIEVEVSGSFRTCPGIDKDRKSFFGVKIVMPECKEDYLITNAMRLFPIARRKNKSISDCNYEGLITLDVDSVKESNEAFPIYDKDIKEMDFAELQYLACAFNLREVPLFNSGGIKEARESTYETFMKVIRKKTILKNVQDQKVLEERIRRRYERDGYTDQEMSEKISEAVADCFNMIKSANPMESYSFSKLKPIIPFKKEVEEKKELAKSK